MNLNEDIERLNTEVEDMSILVGSLATVQAKHNIPRLNNIENHLNERPEVQKVSLDGVSVITLKGDKGETGDEPSDERLEELIIPLIPEPIKGEDGKDYILTEKDKKEIAKSIKVPVVEKIIEKIETIIEQPIVTNEIKEVAIHERAEDIRDKISSLKGEKKLDIQELKGIDKVLEKFRGSLIFNTGAKVLSSLFDVNIQTPTTGQALVYNSTTQKWENANVSGGGTSTYASLTDATTVNLPTLNTPLSNALNTKQNISEKGAVNGYASLDGTGKVPSGQLPSYVDDVLEVADLASLPVTGETGKIYITLDTNKVYRWTGTLYVEVSGGISTASQLANVPSGNISATDTQAAINELDVEKLNVDANGNIVLGNAEGINTINFIGSQADLQIQGASYIGLNKVSGKVTFLESVGTALSNVFSFKSIATASSGIQNILSFTPTIQQTGTAGYTGLLINPTETSLGTGSKRLIDAQTGGVTKFNVDNVGNVNVPAGRINLSNLPALNNLEYLYSPASSGQVYLGSRNNIVFLGDNDNNGNGNIAFKIGSNVQDETTGTKMTIKASGVGIGTTAASALLHLANGTATAGTAPIKLTSGAVLTTPESGAIEYDGTHFYGTIGSTRHQLDQQSSVLSDKNYTEAVVNMTTKIFTHNLNKYPSVSFVDTGGNLIGGLVNHVSINSTEITFTQAISGTASFN